MVWGTICGEQKSQHVIVQGNLTAQRYIDQFLRPVLLPFLHDHDQLGITFQQDARPHVAGIVQEFFQENMTIPIPQLVSHLSLIHI